MSDDLLKMLQAAFGDEAQIMQIDEDGNVTRVGGDGQAKPVMRHVRYKFHLHNAEGIALQAGDMVEDAEGTRYEIIAGDPPDPDEPTEVGRLTVRDADGWEFTTFPSMFNVEFVLQGKEETIK